MNSKLPTGLRRQLVSLASSGAEQRSKSQSLTGQGNSELTQRTFSGLMSRWATPRLCRCSMAVARLSAIFADSSSVKLPRRLRWGEQGPSKHLFKDKVEEV